MTLSVYLMGSLQNPMIPAVADLLRNDGYDVFDDWFSGGPEVDECWQQYEKHRGRSYAEALAGYHAENAFNFDLYHIKRCDLAVMLMPCGRSAHLELGFFRGLGKPGIICLPEEPERYDLMYKFANAVVIGTDELMKEVRKYDKMQPTVSGLGSTRTGSEVGGTERTSRSHHSVSYPFRGF